VSTPEVTIRTGSGTVAWPEHWLAFVARELRAHHGHVIVDSGRPNRYAQAINDDGRLVLEYRDGSPQRHYQACDVGLADIAAALQQWGQGERGFVADHDWERLTDWDPAPEGDGR
jgi:hypothetical protein